MAVAHGEARHRRHQTVVTSFALGSADMLTLVHVCSGEPVQAMSF